MTPYSPAEGWPALPASGHGSEQGPWPPGDEDPDEDRQREQDEQDYLADLLDEPEPATAEPDVAAHHGYTTLTAAALMGASFDAPEPVLAPWLPGKGLAMVYGPCGVGKTHLSLGIAYAIATGGRFLGWHAPKALPVLVLDGEMPATDLQARLASLGEPPPNLRFLAMDLQTGGQLDLANPECQAALDRVIGDARVIIVDNISTLAGSGRENDAESWWRVQSWALRQRR